MIDRALARRLAAVARDRLGDEVTPYSGSGVGSEDFSWAMDVFSVLSAVELTVKSGLEWWAWGRGFCPLAAFRGLEAGEPESEWESTIADALAAMRNRNQDLARKVNGRWDMNYHRPYLLWQSYVKKSLIQPFPPKHPPIPFDPENVPGWIQDLAAHCSKFSHNSPTPFEQKNTLLARVLGGSDRWQIEGMRLRRWALNRGS